MKHFVYIILFSLCTVSCQLGKHYARPDLHLPALLDSTATDTTSIADFRWWELYTDTTLQKLIRETLEHNKDMLTAAARLKEMAAQRRIAYADMFPQVNGRLYTDKEAENYGGDNYKSTPEYTAKFIASWELDLWGNLRWAKDKSMAQFVQAVENRRALQMTLVAQVAQAYFELVALDNELAIVKQTLSAREESVRLARLRFNGGLTSEAVYQQAQVELARTATLVPDLERSIALKENDINFLAGRYPEKVERSHHPQDIRLPETLPAGLPSSLLERRPDVRAAEEALIAANADVGIAYTNLFPRITLTGALWTGERGVQGFPSFALSFPECQPAHAPVCDGEEPCRAEGQEAAYEQAVHQYEKAVLSAFKDARNAMVEFNKVQDSTTRA